MCLRQYIGDPQCGFIKASAMAAKMRDRGSVWHARRIRQWIRKFIASGNLPAYKFGQPRMSILENERVAGEIKLHLQSKGKYICAEDIVEFLSDKKVQEDLGVPRPITVRTAQRWLSKTGYRWKTEPKGQYFDGHERADVVHYRQNTFIPAWQSIEPFMVTWDDATGAMIMPQLPEGRREVVVWFYDQSIFYAHDRKRTRWVHVSERAKPGKKGEGVSIMVSEYISAKYGYLRSRDG